ncbi:hypothetical protein Vretimale_10201 [Volvox reticuliferus]|nr:hypothetical protein Vretimale_10201 [Volvox reticuliferus]
MLVGGELVGQHVALLACGWRHTVCVTTTGRVYSWGRGVNGQLGHGMDQDLYNPTLLSCLTRGQLRRDTILATASQDTDAELYVAPADRYAVVPGADEPYGNGSASVGAVPSMSLLVHEVMSSTTAAPAHPQQQPEDASVEADMDGEGRPPKKARTSAEFPLPEH